jgi:uncharacterized coiled-coil protein SlyX
MKMTPNEELEKLRERIKELEYDLAIAHKLNEELDERIEELELDLAYARHGKEDL